MAAPATMEKILKADTRNLGIGVMIVAGDLIKIDVQKVILNVILITIVHTVGCGITVSTTAGNALLNLGKRAETTITTMTDL